MINKIDFVLKGKPINSKFNSMRINDTSISDFCMPELEGNIGYLLKVVIDNISKRSVKIMYRLKEEGDYGDECALVIDDKIVHLDTEFDNSLGESDCTLEEFTKCWSMKEKLDHMIASICDAYYYGEPACIAKMWGDTATKDIVDYELLEEAIIDNADLIKYVKSFIPDGNFQEKHREEILEKLTLKGDLL